MSMRTKGRNLLAAALVATGLAAVVPSAADAHLGDWSTQYTRTQQRADRACGDGWSFSCRRDSVVASIPGCYGRTQGKNPCYAGSGQWGYHSRWFLWIYEENGVGLSLRRCRHYFRIGHTYQTFYDDRTCQYIYGP